MQLFNRTAQTPSTEQQPVLIGRIAALLTVYGLDQGNALDAARTIVLVAIKRS